MNKDYHEFIDQQILTKFEFDENYAERHREHLERQLTPADYRFGDLEIHCPAKVYHPNIGSSSLFLLSQLHRVEFLPGPSLLEVGTGCGIVALSLARKIRDGLFHGIDNFDLAVESSRQNAKRNSLPLDVFKSDLFKNSADILYDYIIFNPPLLDRPTTDELDLAMMSDPSGATITRFITEAPARLKPGGSIFLVQANFGYTSFIKKLEHPYNWIGCECFANGTMRAVLEIKNL